MSKNAAPIKGFAEFKRFVVARIGDVEVTKEMREENRRRSKAYREALRAPTKEEALKEWCGRKL